MAKKICGILFCIIIVGAQFQPSTVLSNSLRGQNTRDLSPTEIRALTNQQVRYFDCNDVTDVTIAECEALVALYDSTNGAGWKVKTNWLQTPTVSNWWGIYNVVGKSVGRIFLSDNWLTGTIPGDLDKMVDLKRLELPYNALTGQIPARLGNITSLQYMELNDNQLSGAIPAELGNLSNLQILYLSNNALSGAIPPELGSLSSLVYLYLQNNDLTGEIPTSLGNLVLLYTLLLYGNMLEGAIPSSLGSMTNLMYLYLYNNKLSGSIPASLGTPGNHLMQLNLSDNQLTGSIPAELGSLGYLKKVYLQKNQLTGAIPGDLGADDIMEINLSFNQLSGTIPATIFNDGYLTVLDLHANKLHGDVPAGFVNYSPSTLLDLGYNLLNVRVSDPNLADWLAAYDPDWDLTQGINTIIENGGGTITSNDGDTSIEVQADSFDGMLYMTFAPQPEPAYDTGLLSFAGNSFELTSFDSLHNPVTTFSAPLIIKIYYDPADLGGIPEGSLSLYYWDTGTEAWADVVTTCPAGSYTRQPAENWLSVPVCHLSEFALMGLEATLDNHIYLPLIIR